MPGTGVSYAISLESKQFLSELMKARQEAVNAARAIEQGTNAASIDRSADSLRNLAKEMGVVTVSQAELEATFKRARVAQDAANTAAGAYGAGMNGVRSVTAGAVQSQTAMAQLLRGNVAGAFKSATAAVISFSQALMFDPLLAGIAAVTAAVVIMGQKWAEAAQKQREYAQNAGALNDLGRSLDWAREGKNLSNVSGRELEEERRRREQKARELDLDAQVAQERFEKDPTDKNKEAAENAMNAAVAAWGELDTVEAEQDKRANDRRKSREEAAKAARDRRREEERQRLALEERQAELDSRKRYDAIEVENEQKKKGSGRLAALEAERAEKQAKLDDATAFLGDPEKRLKVAEEVFRLEQQIRQEKQRQAEAEERQSKEAVKKAKEDREQQVKNMRERAIMAGDDEWLEQQAKNLWQRADAKYGKYDPKKWKDMTDEEAAMRNNARQLMEDAKKARGEEQKEAEKPWAEGVTAVRGMSVADVFTAMRGMGGAKVARDPNLDANQKTAKNTETMAQSMARIAQALSREGVS